jgi:putative DNA primase/helicase
MRTFSLLPVIRENARVFGRAVSNHLDSPRLGDQLGTLCAGAYSLDSKKVIGIKEAEEWVQAQDWTLSTPVDEAKDHDKCLSLMMQHILRLQGEHKIKDYTIGELIDGVLSGDIDKDADNLLKRHGFKVDRNERLLYIANNHHQLAGIMKDTPYQSWNRLLVRCEGAVQPTNAIRFSSGTVARAVCLPVDLALGKATEETKPEWAF